MNRSTFLKSLIGIFLAPKVLAVESEPEAKGYRGVSRPNLNDSVYSCDSEGNWMYWQRDNENHSSLYQWDHASESWVLCRPRTNYYTGLQGNCFPINREGE